MVDVYLTLSGGGGLEEVVERWMVACEPWPSPSDGELGVEGDLHIEWSSVRSINATPAHLPLGSSPVVWSMEGVLIVDRSSAHGGDRELRGAWCGERPYHRGELRAEGGLTTDGNSMQRATSPWMGSRHRG